MTCVSAGLPGSSRSFPSYRMAACRELGLVLAHAKGDAPGSDARNPPRAVDQRDREIAASRRPAR